MKATAILTADWHIRDSVPICRTDDFIKAQWEKIRWIFEISYRNDSPIFLAGDFFHKARPSISLLNECQSFFYGKKKLYVIPGNHDLPSHNIDLMESSGLYNLHSLFPVHFTKLGEMCCYDRFNDIERKLGLTHKLVTKSENDKLVKHAGAESGLKLLKDNPEYDIIVSGDNHQSFVVEHKGRLLVNPGSITRQTADQIDHEPSVYLWYSQDNTVERVILPYEENVISKEHLETVKEKEKRNKDFLDRMESLGESISSIKENGLSFEGTMKSYLSKNKVRPEVEKLIWGFIEGEYGNS